MRIDYEIHCPNCGTLLRRVVAAGVCPDCGNDQAIFLPYNAMTQRELNKRIHDRSKRIGLD